MYVSSAQHRAFKGAALVPALVVKGEIEKGTTGEQALSKGLIQQETVPEKYRPATALADKEVIRPKVALAHIAAGQVLVDGMFVDPIKAQETAAKVIPEGQVAVTVSVDPIKGVAGLIAPGDRVNIMASSGDGGQRTLFENVMVLYIGATPAPAATTTAAVVIPPSNLITFSVPQIAAQKIVFAATQDTGIYLTLVPPGNKATPIPPTNAGNLFTGGPTPYEG
jgi:pilus assembly protein CpaB